MSRRRSASNVRVKKRGRSAKNGPSLGRKRPRRAAVGEVTPPGRMPKDNSALHKKQLRFLQSSETASACRVG